VRANGTTLELQSAECKLQIRDRGIAGFNKQPVILGNQR
jgi:hypothetical protein